MTPDGIVISILITLVCALGGILYRLFAKKVDSFNEQLKEFSGQVSRIEANQYNFTRCIFTLLAKLNPSAAQVIGEAMQKYLIDDFKKPNGKHYESRS